MTDYSKMSDDEINKAVAEYDLDGDWLLEPTDDRRFTFFNLGVAGKRTAELPNYCNNPSDAWPIILSNLIALKPVKMYVGGHRWFASKGDGDFGLKFADDNPLRAAMIVYLMIKESENGI